MRQFIYTTESKRNSRTGSSNVTANVYEILDNKPNYLGEVNWNTGSFKGETSAVMNFLQEQKVLMVEGSYYHDVENRDFEITGL